MGTIFREFATTPNTLASDLRDRILLSSDWSQPNPGGMPHLVKSTTGRGAQIAINLNAAAPGLQSATFDVFRTHDGTTGTESVRKYLRYRTGNGVLTMPLHVLVSAGRDHLFFYIEGPYAHETNPESTGYGSNRNYLAISEIESYFDLATDPIPAVAVAGRNVINAGPGWVNGSYEIQVSRNRFNTQSWMKGRLLTLDVPGNSGYGGTAVSGTRLTADGNYYLSPYVVTEDADGFRGRLSKLHFAGWLGQTYDDMPQPPINQILTHEGETYKIVPVNKSGTQDTAFDALGAIENSAGTSYARSPAVAIPWAA